MKSHRKDSDQKGGYGKKFENRILVFGLFVNDNGKNDVKNAGKTAGGFYDPTT